MWISLHLTDNAEKDISVDISVGIHEEKLIEKNCWHIYNTDNSTIFFVYNFAE